MVDLIFRWMHVLAACVLVGCSYFACFVQSPRAACGNAEGTDKTDTTGSGKTVSDGMSASLDGTYKRLGIVLRLACLFLFASGFVNAVRISQAHSSIASHYQVAIAAKVVLAAAVFGLVDRITGEGPSADRLRKSERGIWRIIVILVTVLVLLAGYMRTIERTKLPIDNSENAAVMPVTVFLERSVF